VSQGYTEKPCLKKKKKKKKEKKKEKELAFKVTFPTNTCSCPSHLYIRF
jgi:hypothetical protein